MKKLNNKGITMIELIITIALISVIMVFLYSLLSNITFESDNEFIDITDASIREDMIRTINDTLTEYNETIEKDSTLSAEQKITNKLQDYGYSTSSDATYIQIKDGNGTSIYQIIVSDNTLKLEKGTSNKIQSWTLTEGTFDKSFNDSRYKACNTVGSTEANAIKVTTCSIKVYTGNINNKYIDKGTGIDNNNTLDDITFIYGTITSNV